LFQSRFEVPSIKWSGSSGEPLKGKIKAVVGFLCPFGSVPAFAV